MKYYLPFYLFFSLILFAQTIGAQATVQEAVQQFYADPELAGATIAIKVIDVSTGAEVAGVNAELSCIPASTQKLITTAAAMDVLDQPVAVAER